MSLQIPNPAFKKKNTFTHWPAPKKGSDLKKNHSPNLKKAPNQNNTDAPNNPPSNCNKGDTLNNPHNNCNKRNAPSNCNKGDNCIVCRPTYVLRVESEYYDLVYMRRGTIRYLCRNKGKASTRKNFRADFARKAHDIIALPLAPIDGHHFDYNSFIKAYDLVADNLKRNKIACVMMDKMKYTTFTTVYENWFKRTD